MKLAKRILMAISLGALSAACLMLILAIFGVSVFTGVGLRVLLAFATLAVGGSIAISELLVYNKRKILGIVGLSFLSLSVVLALISFATNLFITPIFNQIVGVIALCSVLFAIITSINTKLNTKLMALQIVTYIVLVIVNVMLMLLICGINIFEISLMPQIFGMLCVLTVGLIIGCGVTSKKSYDDVDAKNFEVEELKKQNEQLKQQILKLEEELNRLKNND